MFCEISQDLQIWNIPWPLKLSILVEWPTYVSWKFHSSDPPHEAMTTPSAQTCGALNLPYLWFNFIRRKWWSRTVVSNSIESCWEQLNMVLLLLCTGAVKAVLKLRLQPSHLPYHISEATFTAKSSSISYPPARHVTSHLKLSRSSKDQHNTGRQHSKNTRMDGHGQPATECWWHAAAAASAPLPHYLKPGRAQPAHRHSRLSFKLHVRPSCSMTFRKKIQTNLPMPASVQQLGNRHQYDVDRNDDGRGSKHQQLFIFSRSMICAR